jgi:hypothetical protein
MFYRMIVVSLEEVESDEVNHDPILRSNHSFIVFIETGTILISTFMNYDTNLLNLLDCNIFGIGIDRSITM